MHHEERKPVDASPAAILLVLALSPAALDELDWPRSWKRLSRQRVPNLAATSLATVNEVRAGEGAEEWMHFLFVVALHSVNRWEY
jgi:hypothetical protein